MTTYSFKKKSRLLHKRQFQEMATGSKTVGRLLVISVLQTKSESAKLGITVTKRYGKANLRNCFKRKVREAFRLSQLPNGLHIHVKPKMGVEEIYSASMHEFQKEIASLQTV